ncbi:DoxX family protein [Dyadobacter diqingensis]|uniref:DoxX family protein n=1 Tax=Dyadobacter diqingensis TaxID=2938121 RepID=UPI0020C19273|nr:DoxX family protein [Dyadobacter diqingensis]
MAYLDFLTGLKVCDSNVTTRWTKFEKSAFRILFLFFCLQILPIDPYYLKMLRMLKISSIGYEDIFNISHYYPRFLFDSDKQSNWLILISILLAGDLIWSFLDKRLEYNNLYYWLRVVLRYRLAAALIAYGFIKLIPIQFPDPSISNLNTSYGDFTAWKLLSMSLGIVPKYESLLGLIEIIAALLLLNRKTVPLGCILIILFTGNVFITNLAYEGNESAYALYLLILASFLLCYDAPRILTLLTSSVRVQPGLLRLNLTKNWQKYSRFFLKSVFIFFFIFFYGLKITVARVGYQYPNSAGLAALTGFYDVKEFRVNGYKHPYSLTDTIRWNNVVFEKWPSVSIGTIVDSVIDSTYLDSIPKLNKNRNYEFAGSGGRRYYQYEADTLKRTLLVSNRNRHYEHDIMLWHYDIVNPSQIKISYLNTDGDSIFVQLNKINKKYLLYESQKVDRAQGIRL